MENKKIAILGLIYAYADEAMGYMDVVLQINLTKIFSLN